MENFCMEKNIYYKFVWVRILLLGLGVLLLIPAIIMQILPMGPNSFNLTINGIPQPYNDQNLQIFRGIFLAAFGIPSMILIIVSVILFILSRRKRNQEEHLKKYGELLKAGNIDFIYSAVWVNYSPTMRLVCSYTTSKGENIGFKSKILRYDPTPYLLEDNINVYCDQYDKNRYFVDVEGSMEDIYED